MKRRRSLRAGKWFGPPRGGRRRGRGWRLSLPELLVIVAAGLLVTAILQPGPDAARAFSIPAAEPVAGNRLVGRGRVVDGDTLDVGRNRVRLHGMDAFERDQTCERGGGTWDCGRASTRALRRLVDGRDVICEVRDTDRYGRLVSRCAVNGVDVAEQMVAEGAALAYRRYSRDYVDEEEAARAAGLGAWAGSFDRPEQWRRGA